MAAVIVAATIKGGDTAGTDEFIAKQAWLYAVSLKLTAAREGLSMV